MLLRNSDGQLLECYPTDPYSEEAYSQLDLVYMTLHQNRHKWMTLKQISELTGIPKEKSIASRIRDLRADGLNIEHRTILLDEDIRIWQHEYCWTY